MGEPKIDINCESRQRKQHTIELLHLSLLRESIAPNEEPIQAQNEHFSHSSKDFNNSF